jgi:hypothetical protein
MANTDNDPVVEHPTWYGQVRGFFTEIDVAHMAAKGIDLGTYAGVKANAVSIYSQTSSGSMPPPPATQWSANRIQTFLNWITDNYPLGTPTTAPAEATAQGLVAAAAPRIRKEIGALSPAEVAALTTAFQGILALDPSDPNSYFAIAGVHWFPAITANPDFHCLHHENRFLPWHRFHLKRFEDALRSVPGCADVTLPYWDVTGPVPPLLYTAPFAQYTAQAPVNPEYDPLTTSRNTAAEIAANVAAYGIPDIIANALTQSIWEKFNKTFWAAHDNGHDSCGPTMSNQDISSFDPIFWFFHCNLDRIWLQWQQAIGATTLAGFKSTCQTSTAWLDNPILGALPPFSGTSAQAVVYAEVDYDPPQQRLLAMAFENKSGSVEADKRFRIDSQAPLSVRVKDIDRSGIPGTFVVHLLADGQEVARQAFFQPTDPGVCSSCSENAKVPIDFLIAPDKILDKDLTVEIHVPNQREMGTRFPLSKAGSPTINVRHLVEGD